MNDFQTESKWYVLQALSGQEDRAMERLKLRIEQDKAVGIDSGIDDLQIPVDMIDTGRKTKDHKPVLRAKKRYPGYILIKCRLYDQYGERIAATWELINQTQGIIGFVGYNEPAMKDQERNMRPMHPVEIPRHEIEEMLRHQEEANEPKRKIDYKIGETVQLRGSAFVGYEGVIENIDNEHGRLKVSVSMFGRSTPVEVGIDEVERPM